MVERPFSVSHVLRTASWAVVVIVALVVILEAAYALKHYWHWRNELVTVRPKIAGVVYIKGKRTAGIQLRAAIAGRTNPPCVSRPVIATSSSMGSFIAPALREHRYRVASGETSLAVCLMQGNTEVDSWVSVYRPGALPPILLTCEYPIEEGRGSAAHACFSTP